MIRLSIIVPVYNVELYLRKCVDSLLCQDLNPKDYEIILVDDGSPDGCPAICDEYANASSTSNGTMPSIIAIHQANRGLSGARNSGIRIARGKYVMFVDSDDYLQPNVLHNLVDQMEREQLDVLRYNYQLVHIVRPNEYEAFWPYKQPRQTDLCTEVVDGVSFLNNRLDYRCYAWAFVIRRDLLEGCIFTEGINFEDVDWTPRMLLKAQRVNSTPDVVYNYLMREGSITGTTNITKKRKNIEDMMAVIGTLNDLFAIHPACHWLAEMRSATVANVLVMVSMLFYNECPSYIARLHQLHCFPLAIAKQGRTFTHRAQLINISPQLFCMLMRLRSMAKRTL